MSSYKIAKVTWTDASHYRSEDSIQWLRDNAGTSDFETVGHIIKTDRKVIILAHEINDDGRARDTSVIPRGMIKKITYLSESDGS